MDGNITTAILSFINIQPEDGNEYSCITIFPNGDSDVKTIRVIVDPGTLCLHSYHTTFTLNLTEIFPLLPMGYMIHATNYR